MFTASEMRRLQSIGLLEPSQQRLSDDDIGQLQAAIREILHAVLAQDEVIRELRQQLDDLQGEGG